MLKIILLFFVFMYSVDFIPTLGGAILPALIIDPHGFFSVYGGGGEGAGERGNIPWDPTRVLASDLGVVYFICYD